MPSLNDTVPAVIDESRRRWLVRGFWAATSLVSAIVGSPLIAYFLGPLFRQRADASVRLGRLAEFPTEQPQRVEFTLRRRDGWVVDEGRQAAWLVRRGDTVRVFDPRCTHLGCAYHWHAETRQFLCPCHNGLFDLDGRVAGGPPPRPLDEYDVSIRDGSVFVVPTPRARTT